jgi:5-methylcytosine-specific restriction endonuclease McrA
MAAGTSGNHGQGMNFVRKEKRIALYLRDGLACCYCGAGLEDGITLTLDHLTPRSLTATADNTATNLITACEKCNKSRGNRDWREFAAKVADYLNHDTSAAQIIAHIETTVQRPVDVPAAKAILAARGGYTKAMHSLR